MTQRHTSSSFVEVGKVVQRLVAGSVLALVVALAPAALAAQDQQPLTSEAGGDIVSSAATQSAASDLRTQALPPEIEALGKPTTQLIWCGPGGCMVCNGLRCLWDPWW